MQNTLTFPPLRPSETEVVPTFNVVIVYEDFETGKHAKKTYDFLVEHLGDECVFANQMWKFDVLAVGKLKEIAAKDASAADIIIVSAHGSGDLPPEVKAWTEAWLKEKTRAIALVGLFDSPEYLDNPARSYLAGVARRAQIEFFSQPGVWPGGDHEESPSADNWDRNKTFSVLADMVQIQPDRNISHWGINE
jgi:hypothetical protein